MRPVHPTVQAYREGGRPAIERHLLWVVARNDAGDKVRGGFWTGSWDQQIQVVVPADGSTATRAYVGGLSLLEVEPISHQQGLDVLPVRLRLAIEKPEVEAQVRGLDVRGAAVEVHRVWLDDATRSALAPAEVWTVGHIEGAPITVPAAGGEATLVYSVTPLTRLLTIANPEVLSGSVQRRRDGDRILQYVGGVPAFQVPWGTKA